MTTLSIHPIEYLRDHVDYAHIAKRLFRLLVVIGFTLFLVGGLCKTLAYTAAAERDALTQTYMDAFPAEMPDVVIGPAVYAPLG
jgi:hypothetical protein